MALPDVDILDRVVIPFLDLIGQNEIADRLQLGGEIVDRLMNFDNLVLGRLPLPGALDIPDQHNPQNDFVNGIFDSSIQFREELSGNDLVFGTNDSDRVSTFEGHDTVFLLDGDDFADGGSGNDYLDGGNGADTLIGGEGEDTLIGGAGNDHLQGGPGADRFEGGDGTDTVVYADSAAGIVALFSASDGFGIDRQFAEVPAGGYAGDAQGDTYGIPGFSAAGSIEQVIGSPGNDQIYGADGAFNAELGDGNDVFDNNEDVDALNVVFGEGGDDKIWTGAGNDTLVGGNGNDALFGEKGDDRLEGGAGNDHLEGGPGADALLGGEDTDTAVYARSPDGVVALFSATDGFGVGGQFAGELAGGHGGDAEGDRYDSVEQVIGSPENDLIYGADGAFNAQLGAGNDIFDNNANVDAPNLVLGEGGNDTIWTGAGNDTLVGGDGNDSLFGEMGDDRLTGGTGDDIFIFAPGSGRDVITDFAGEETGGEDKIDVHDYGVTDLSGLSIADNGQGDAVIAFDAESSVTLLGVHSAQLTAQDFLFAV